MIPISERDTLLNTREQWHRVAENVQRNLRVAAPAIVESFDAKKQTVTVQLAIKERRNYDGTYQKLPIIGDIPLVMPRAGSFAITMPVTKGDEVLIVFGDQCMDAWWQNGNVQNPMDQRRHHLSDAYAIIGTWSQPRTIQNYDANNVQLRSSDANANVCITLSANGISITSTSGNVSIAANGTVAIAANGSVAISANGNTNIEGGLYLQHTHSNAGGSGDSGPVVKGT